MKFCWKSSSVTLFILVLLASLGLNYYQYRQIKQVNNYLQSGHVWMMDNSCSEQLINSDQLHVMIERLDETNR